MGDFTIVIRPGSWYCGLDVGTSAVQIDLFKAHHYHADRDILNLLPWEEPCWTGMYIPLLELQLCLRQRKKLGSHPCNFRCHGGRYLKNTFDLEQVKINEHSLLCHTDDDQHIKAKEGRHKMDEGMKRLYRGGGTTLRDGSPSQL